MSMHSDHAVNRSGSSSLYGLPHVPNILRPKTKIRRRSEIAPKGAIIEDIGRAPHLTKVLKAYPTAWR